jgi:hypothetical protein
MALAMTRPTKHPRTGMYQVRVWVPEPLRPYLRRRELVASLGVKDPAEAKRLAPAVVSEFREQIEEARRRAAAGEPPAVSRGAAKGIKPVRTGRAASQGPAPRIVPGEADIRAVVIRWLHGASREDLSAPIPDDPEAAEEALQAVRADISALADPEQGWQHASAALLATLAAHGFAAPPVRLSGFGTEMMRSAVLERYRLIEQRLSGTLSDVTIANPALAGASPLLAPPPRPVPTKEPVRAEALLAAWTAEAKPAHSWRHRMEDELRRVRALPEVMDAITGRHNPRNAGAGYGKGFRAMPDEVLKDLGRIPSPCPPAGGCE